LFVPRQNALPVSDPAFASQLQRHASDPEHKTPQPIDKYRPLSLIRQVVNFFLRTQGTLPSKSTATTSPVLVFDRKSPKPHPSAKRTPSNDKETLSLPIILYLYPPTQ
jgi:hypothetical protein